MRAPEALHWQIIDAQWDGGVSVPAQEHRMQKSEHHAPDVCWKRKKIRYCVEWSRFSVGWTLVRTLVMKGTFPVHVAPEKNEPRS